jgi:PAS domain S-box-containing protein
MTRDTTREAPGFLAGGGELGARMREMDWSWTSLGAPEKWPQSLRTAVRIMLTSRQPASIWWGPESIVLYNDAHKAIVGGKHPGALGQPASVVWHEIWNQVEPRAGQAPTQSEGSDDGPLLLLLERNGYLEETYYTFSYSPIPADDGGSGGLFCINTDETRHIIGERQLNLLREVAAQTADVRTLGDACTLSARSLQTNPQDLPFALIYLRDPATSDLRLAGSAGFENEHTPAPRHLNLGETANTPFAEALSKHRTVLLADLPAHFGTVPRGLWAEPPTQAAIVPLSPDGETGVLVVGLNPYRRFDDFYSGFIDLVTRQIGASLNQARAYEAEHARAEAVRREKEVRGETTRVLESISQGFMGLDREFRITYINAEAEALLGASKQEILGRTQWEAFPTTSGTPMEEALRRVARDRSPATFESFYAPTQRWFQAWVYPARREGLSVYLRDITERKLADRDRRLLAAIVESSEDAIISKDLDGIIMSWNKGAQRIFGYTAEEVIGRPITILIPPENHDEERLILSRLRRGERIETYECIRVTKDGRRLDISLTISPIHDEMGRFVGASKVARDITARKRAEQMLKEADRRKDEFLATLAHELRNPLAPIRNGLQLMQMAGDNREVVEKARSVMERQLKQMVRLIDDLLDLSRISQGKVELRCERLDLAAIIQSAIETSRPLIDQAGHHLHLTLPEKPLFVNADMTRLAQVFSNLLNNAAKYTEKSGQIWLSARHEGAKAVISIRDNGIGIPPAMLPRIFEMFTQVDQSLEKSHGGLGIGLNIVQRLVEMHEGTVTAESEGYGHGSEFIVTLPVAPDQPEAGGDAVSQGAKATTNKRRILVADDNLDIAESLAMMLQLEGNEVRLASDGQEAVELAEEYQPDVILLDIGMPRLNGYEACREIRRQPWSKNAVIFALTGWGQEEDLRQSREAGFNHHLVKPVEPSVLFKMLPSIEGGKRKEEGRNR